MKLKRAKQHLDELITETREFLGDQPYTISKYDDLKRGLHIERYEAKIGTDALGFLPGEFTYCMRSALDHLAWNLSLLTTVTPAPNTQFPIQTEFTKRSQERFASQTRDIPLKAVRIIKSLQPYQRRTAFKSDLLWQLDKLCNADKHRFIIFSHSKVTFTNLSVPMRRRETDNGFDIAVPLAFKDNCQLQMGPAEAIFGDPVGTPDPIEVGLDGFSRIYEYVRNDVIPQFEVFF